MPFHHFVDDELIEETEKLKLPNKIKNESLEEHQFIANCLQMGFRIEDLKQMQYKDVMKIMICLTRKDEQENNATQADIDKFLK